MNPFGIELAAPPSLTCTWLLPPSRAYPRGQPTRSWTAGAAVPFKEGEAPDTLGILSSRSLSLSDVLGGHGREGVVQAYATLSRSKGERIKVLEGGVGECRGGVLCRRSDGECVASTCHFVRTTHE